MKYVYISLFSMLLFVLYATQILADDQWDPGDNSKEGVTTLTINDSIQSHGPHTLTPTIDNEDWFRVYLSYPNHYNFYTPFTSGHADIYIYDAYPFEEVASNSGTGESRLHFMALKIGWYYIRVCNPTSDCSYTLKYNRVTKKQRFQDTQIACATADHSWSFITRWNLHYNDLTMSPQWYNGDYEWRYSLIGYNQWNALFIYDEESMHTWELLWAYHSEYVK